MKLNGLIFYLIVIANVIAGIKVIWIEFLAKKYIKQKYQVYYKKNMGLFTLGSRSGSTNIHIFARDLNDIVVHDLKQQWDRAFRMSIIVMVSSFTLFVIYTITHNTGV